MGWFSDAVSSVGDFFTAPLDTTSKTIDHVSSVASNNPVATAAAIAAAAYFTGGASLAAEGAVAGGAAIEGAASAASFDAALATASAAEATAAATSGFTLSQAAGATLSTLKSVGQVAGALSLALPKPTASRLNSGLGVNYFAAPQTAAGLAPPGGAGATARDVVAAPGEQAIQPRQPLDNQALVGYALGALALYEVLK